MIHLLSFVFKKKKNISTNCSAARVQKKRKNIEEKFVRCPTSLIVAYIDTKYTPKKTNIRAFCSVRDREQSGNVQNDGTMAASDKASDDSLYPIAVLIDELKNEDIQVNKYH